MHAKVLALAAALAATLSFGPAQAQSKVGGCLKYGLGGAIAGHVAGGHRIKGALAGCAIGVMERRRQEQAARERGERNRTAERRRPEQAPSGRAERERTVERRRPEPEVRRAPPAPGGRAGPYEDLGLDPSLSGRAGRVPGPTQRRGPQPDDFGQGGSFSRSQPQFDPDATGSFGTQGGTVY